MGFFLFQNGSVYYEHNSQRGVLSIDVFKTSPLAKTKDAVVFFTDVDTRRLVAPDSDPAKREEMFGNVFPNDVQAQAERVSGNTYQVFGAQSSVICEIYGIFGKENVKVLAPYSIGIRSFLAKRGVVPPDKTGVVLDDLGDKFVLTIFKGLEVSISREISQRPVEKIVEEVLRSQKEYENQVARETHNPDFYFVSNNKVVCAATVELGLYLAGATAFIDGTCPVFQANLDGINVHFSLPEDVVRLRKLKEIKKNFWVYLVGGGIAAAGLLYFLVGVFWYGSVNGRVTELTVKEAQLQKEINNEMAGKYRDVIRHVPKADFLKIVDSFRQNIPFAFSLETISLKDAGDTWEIRGVVYSNQKLLSDFGDKGVFKNRTIENVFVRNLPAQKVTAVLKKGE